jgi:glycosyltransferase involved in cell wall biosynthesis
VEEASRGDPRVKYLGRVSEEEKMRLYQSSWAVLSTSFVEGWGMTVTEANACGTPVLGYATGAIPELVRDGVNGLLVRYGDVRGLASLMQRALDERFSASLWEGSYRESLKYDWDLTASAYEDYLESMPRR